MRNAHKNAPDFLFHLLAIFAVMVWGTTFVSTKTLIFHGLTPTEIFIYRFALAYVSILFVSHDRLFSSSLSDELLLVAAGITGGSLYFVTENSALGLTQASNVAMIISICPLLTTLLAMAVSRSERGRNPWRVVAGSLIALIGVAVVVCNGRMVMQFNLRGDLLTLAAALSWAVYSLLIKRLGRRYPAAFMTRKVFAYGLISIGLWEVLGPTPQPLRLELLADRVVLANLLFLGFVASMLCFTVWSAVVKRIGMVKSTNYIYLNPIVTFISAYLILGERLSAVSLAGAAVILAGVYIVEKR